MALWAVEKLPAASPSTILPTKRKSKEFEAAKINQPIDELKILIIRIGLRPILSDKAPRTGELKNENKAKTEKRIVIVLGLAPKEDT